MSITPTPQEEEEDSWETGEVINWLTNDEDCWNALRNKGQWYIFRFVRKNHEAPSDLYSSFRREKGKWGQVNWKTVTQSLREE